MKLKFLKALAAAAICLFAQSSLATNYYFSNSTGDDSRTTAQANSPATPWKTITKLNSFFPSLKPGDSVLFKRGDTFYGAIAVKISGSSALPVILSAYGTGAKPIISGFTILSSWSSLGAGIYQSSCAACSVTDNMVVMNGAAKPIGRYPNSGYLAYQSHSGTGSITSSRITGSTNWAGAEVVVRANHWILNRNPIASVSGSTINFTAASSDGPTDGFGFFIQNSPKTLDSLGEWYFEPTGKNMQMFFGTNSPASYTVKTSTVNTLVSISGYSYITFDGLAFQGSNVNTFQLGSAQHILVKNCNIDMSGADAIDGSSSPYFTLQNSTISHSLNDAINLDGGCTSASITSNLIKNTGFIPGMGKSNTGTYQAISSFGASSMIKLNEIDSTAYDGIYFAGSGTSVVNNLVNYFCSIKDDGGGIYCGDKGTSVRNITGNIILNGIGAAGGTNATAPFPVEGIYLDDSSTNYSISGNTVAACSDAGIKVHNANTLTITGNILYDNGSAQLLMSHDNVAPNSPIRSATITGNVFVSRTTNEFAMSLSTIANDISSFGTFNTNYYCRPMDDNITIYTQFVDATNTQVIQPYDLAGWQAASGQDAASKKSPITFLAYTIASLVGSSQASNGTFNTDLSGMHAYSPANDCIASWNSGGKLDGGAVQVQVGSPSASGIVINVGSVSPANQYILRFSAIGGTTSYMDAYLRQTAQSYLPLISPGYFKATTTRGEYEMLLSFPASSATTSIIFESHAKSSTYWLDNVQLYQANVTPTNTSQYISFLYNPTAANKSFALSQSYVDAMNNVYTSSVTVKPYSSVVLIAKSAGNLVKSQKTANPAVSTSTTPVKY